MKKPCRVEPRKINWTVHVRSRSNGSRVFDRSQATLLLFAGNSNHGIRTQVTPFKRVSFLVRGGPGETAVFSSAFRGPREPGRPRARVRPGLASGEAREFQRAQFCLLFYQTLLISSCLLIRRFQPNHPDFQTIGFNNYRCVLDVYFRFRNYRDTDAVLFPIIPHRFQPISFLVPSNGARPTQRRR